MLPRWRPNRERGLVNRMKAWPKSRGLGFKGSYLARMVADEFNVTGLGTPGHGIMGCTCMEVVTVTRIVGAPPQMLPPVAQLTLMVLAGHSQT
jgi:hypothetical protein